MISNKRKQECVKHHTKCRDIAEALPSDAITYLIIIFFIGIIVLLIFSSFNVLSIPSLSTEITALASLMMAICSGLNLLLVLKQDVSHKKQIEELELSRKMSDRPMPCIRDIKISIDPPKLYHGCHEKGCKYLSRYHISIDIDNISDYPIPTLFASVLMKCSEDKELYDGLYFGSDYKSGISSHAKKQKLSLMCAIDNDAKFYNSLRKEFPQEYSRLRCYIYYKSFSGGCFLLTQDFLVLPPEGTDEKTIIDWQTSITSIKTKYANLFADIMFYSEQGDDDMVNKIYKDLHKIIENEHISNMSETINLYEIPGGLNIETLNEEEYKKYTDRINCGHLCGKKPSCLYTNKCND